MSTRDAGGDLVRRLLPAAILVAVAVGWGRWQAQPSGFLGSRLGVVLFTISIVVIFSALIFITVRSLSAVDASRRSAVEKVAASRERELVVAARLAAIVSSSVDAIIGKTLSGEITSWNDGAEQMYGYSASEMVGRNVSVLVPPDRAEELADILDRVAVGSRVEHHETERVAKDGSILQVAMTVSPIRDASGAIVGASAVTRDLTEFNRASADRKKLAERLRQAERLESVGQLAGGIAHDFNNLIGVIMNYADFVAEETADLPAVRADVAAIRDAAERAARLTRQLLIFARRDAIQPEFLSLNAVVVDIENLLSQSIGEHVALVVRTARDLPTVHADRGQMEQVLVNLAVNARDAMPAGGTLTIETESTTVDLESDQLNVDLVPGRYVKLTVSDTGLGMSAEVAARIFEPFFTTKPTGKGTGLGLATVYGIVREAGGDLSVDSTEGTGTTFRVYFPARNVQPTALSSDTVALIPGRGETVLVVEDEPAVLELTSRILRANGYTVLEASTFETAELVAAGHDFQLLLTDSIMPGLCGRELSERILELHSGHALLYMSGYSEGALGPLRVSDAGVRLVQKPFTQQDLLGAVHLALANRIDGSAPVTGGS